MRYLMQLQYAALITNLVLGVLPPVVNTSSLGVFLSHKDTEKLESIQTSFSSSICDLLPLLCRRYIKTLTTDTTQKANLSFQ